MEIGDLVLPKRSSECIYLHKDIIPYDLDDNFPLKWNSEILGIVVDITSVKQKKWVKILTSQGSGHCFDWEIKVLH
jgi:hypothetical protein